MSGIRKYNGLRQRVLPRGYQPRRSEHALVQRVNMQAETFAALDDGSIADEFQRLRELVDDGAAVTDERIATPGFALIKEAARRALGKAHYDVQLLAGAALASGAVAEMQTGEGKTLTSTLPVALQALRGEGVHVATVNRYLAERDFDELRPVYEMLGLSVGLSADGANTNEKQEAYHCDITYATGYELGFDYLRDEVARRAEARQPLGRKVRSQLRGAANVGPPVAQRGHAVAIIDEVDSVLIDEANTPLVLSGSAGEQSDPFPYLQAQDVTEELREGEHFNVRLRERNVQLTEAGADYIFKTQQLGVAGQDLGVSGHWVMPNLMRPWAVYVEQALRARLLMHRDVDYVIRNGEVQIVDQNTGRIFEERHWRDGLHQAVEAKEGARVTEEKRSIARVARQRYMQLYRQPCGMTGTASGHEREFLNVYGLPIVQIPLRKPCQRNELPTRYFADAEAKWLAVGSSIAERHRDGQPILVGTRTIAGSRQLAEQLQQLRLPFQLLNGIQDANESDLIAVAGQAGAITIATNMAGRGTDIKPSDEALSAGGLHVIAAERHDSARIDRQLVGRAARQGDPGSCQFFVSADDDLIERFDPSLAKKMKQVARGDGSVELNLDETIRHLQSKAESESYERRARLLRQELWLNEVLNTVA
jgi:preprotein translocase subunit SecA